MTTRTTRSALVATLAAITAATVGLAGPIGTATANQVPSSTVDTPPAAPGAAVDPSLTADPVDIVVSHLAGTDAGPDEPLRVLALREGEDGPVVEVVEVAGPAQAEDALAGLQQDETTIAVGIDVRRTVSDRAAAAPAALTPTALSSTTLSSTVLAPAAFVPTVLAPAPGAPSDDPYRPQLWGLGALDAERAWLGSRGEGVVVAVLDTGVAAAHPDLAGRVLPGHDTVRGDRLPDRTGRTDPEGHGTHVAGIVAATAGNRTGVAGIAPGSSVLPVRVLDRWGGGWDADIATGIVWAADHGADVISLSLGGPEQNQVLAGAVSYAQSKDVLVVAAVGNHRRDGNEVQYPAAFPGVLGVAALQPDRAVATYSGTGSHVDVAAPGSGVVSTVPGGYESLDGTSMATPYVAGAAALLLSASGGTMTAVDLADALSGSATDLPPSGRDSGSGAGLVQPVAAMCTQLLWCPPVLPDVRPRLQVVRSSRSTSAITAGVRAVDSRSGLPVPGLPVVVETRRPGAPTELTSLVTDAQGRAGHPVALAAGATVRALSGGTRHFTEAESPVVAVDAPPVTAVLPRRAGASVVVSPAVGQRLVVQRRSGTTWTAVATRTAPPGSTVLVDRLPPGTYRVQVSAVPGMQASTSRTWSGR